MNDILSSLEHEHAQQAGADRDTDIARLRELEANGRGQLAITPGSLILGLFQLAIGVAIAYFTFFGAASMSTKETLGGYFGIALFAGIGVWMVMLSRQPLFTLTEAGLDIRGTLLPWGHIEDYEVNTNGIPVSFSTAVIVHHVLDHEPPGVRVFRAAAQRFDRNSGRWQTVLMMIPKARGLSAEALSEHIGRFMDGALAREALRELKAEPR